jgi:hypothetical protein
MNMGTARRLIVTTVLILCYREVSGQSLGLGRCPSHPAMKELDLKKVCTSVFLFFENIKSCLHSCLFPATSYTTIAKSSSAPLSRCVVFTFRFVVSNWFRAVVPKVWFANPQGFVDCSRGFTRKSIMAAVLIVTDVIFEI